MDKLIVTVATTGGGTSKEQQPNLPLTCEEITNSAIECYNEGASIVHIHVRDPRTGLTSHDSELYREVVERIREKTDMIINLTTAAGALLNLKKLIAGQQAITGADERCEPLILKPELCSLDLGTMNIGDNIFASPIPHGEKMARIMLEMNVKAEIEIFDAGHIDIAALLLNKGLIKKPAHFQLCLGVKGGISASARNLVYLVDSLPRGSTWSVLGIGTAEFPMVGMAVLMGGHARVGFEDNIYIEKGVLAKSNTQLVKKAVDMARALGREIATPKEAREILGLGTI